MKNGLTKAQTCLPEQRYRLELQIHQPPETCRLCSKSIVTKHQQSLTKYHLDMKKFLFVLITGFLLTHLLHAQTSDDQFIKPLKQVLDEVQSRFDVTIRYPEELVTDRWVTYADWRVRPGLEKTLTNILSSQDLTFVKEGDRKYKLKRYEYYRWSFEDGKEQAEYLAGLYNDSVSWIQRKKELKECMWEALRLKGIPEWPDAGPVISKRRKMDGYDIENVALQVIPGVYTFGSVYKSVRAGKKSPVILCPNGHWKDGRYRANHQIRCAMMARMGAVVVSYDLFAWGESMLQFKYEDHRRSLAMTMQVLNTFRFLDYLLEHENTDEGRIAIVGGSGAGSHSMLITALDDRIKVCVPTVMLSCYMYGGCPCESGMPVHLCGNGTNNIELSAMAAPRPQLIISDGKDWTSHVPEFEFPLVQRIYSIYGKSGLVENAHFADEGHDFGPSKRMALYPFIAKHLQMDISRIKDKAGNIDESWVTVEEAEAMYVLDNDTQNLPDNAIVGFDNLVRVFQEYIK